MFRKINALLHDVTIINFKLLGVIFLRYRLASFIAFLTVIFSISYFYFTQLTIHTKKVFFKVYAQDEMSGKKQNISELMGDLTKSFLSQGEVSAIINNYDFSYGLSKRLVDSPDLNRLDFNDPNVKTFKSNKMFFHGCQDKECRIKRVQGIVQKLYSLETELGTGRFILKVTTRSSLTTLVLIHKFKETLVLNRYEAAYEQNEKQIRQVQHLIDASRKGIKEKGGFAKMAPGESLEALIMLQHDKIRGITQRLSIEIDQYHFQQIRLKQAEATANKNIKGINRMEYENYSKILKKMENQRENIASINATPLESRSDTDKAILDQLGDELKHNEEELKKIGKIKRNLTYDDKFINTQINNQTNFEFDYKVTLQKVKKLEHEAEVAKKELDELYAKKFQYESEHLTFKPDLEYLKSMESKMVELKMLRTTIKTDVVFDDFGPEVMSFKRNSLAQITMFSFALITFLHMIVLMFIYMLDDRIYDQYEIEKCLDDLQVIGVSPTNEKSR